MNQFLHPNSFRQEILKIVSHPYETAEDFKHSVLSILGGGIDASCFKFCDYSTDCFGNELSIASTTISRGMPNAFWDADW